jgi:membrane protease subunit (stomatin/prohibitin family)
MMDEKVFDEPVRKRGLQIEVFSVESVTLDPDSERKIEEYEHNSNSRMQQGRVLDVMEKAASNANGAANGFMGIGMMNMASQGMGSAVMQNAFNPNQATAAPAQEAVPQNNADAWVCPTCGKTVTEKFCGECGTKKPEGKVCPNCGTAVSKGTKFCGECGTKL